MPQDLHRRANTVAVLRTLAAGGPASVAELRGSVGLSRPTLDAIVADLLGDGLIRQTDPHERIGDDRTGQEKGAAREKGVGRPARTFMIDPDAAFVAGVDVGRHKVLVMIADLTGTVRVARRVAVPARIDGAGLLDLVRQTLISAAAAGSIGFDQLRAVAVGVPGVVDSGGRITRSVVVPQWSGFDIRRLLADRTDLRVTIGNDANLAVLAEQWRGPARLCRDVVYLLAGRRTRAAIMINGEVLTGRRGEAGEIGSVPELFFDTPEVLLDDPAADSSAVAEVFAAAGRGEADSRQHVDRFCAELARSVRFLVTVLDPEMVVIGGGLSAAGQQIVDGVRDHLGPSGRQTELVASPLGDAAVALGGVRQALLDVGASDVLMDVIVAGHPQRGNLQDIEEVLRAEG